MYFMFFRKTIRPIIKADVIPKYPALELEPNQVENANNAARPNSIVRFISFH